MATTKKYNHAFTIAFSINSDNEGTKVTNEELLAGILKRISDIVSEGDCEFIECCGVPYDTYENEVPNSIDLIKGD